MSSRIYAVSGPDSFRLVEAASKHAAIRHATKDMFVAQVANQKILVAAMQDGIKVEQAGAEDQAAE